MWEMDIVVAKRIFGEQAGLSMKKTAEDNLSDAFFGGFEEPSTGLKNASYYFMGDVLSEMVTKYSMDDVFERNLRRWTQSFSFMGTFNQSDLNSLCFVRPVAKIIRKTLKSKWGLPN